MLMIACQIVHPSADHQIDVQWTLKEAMTSSDNYSQRALDIHRQLKGKIKVTAKTPVERETDLSLFYTPGVGAVSSLLANNPEKLGEYTIKNNLVAVISDGSAVLGLGNVGAAAALPVMEGKAMLLAQLAGLDAFPIVLDTQDTDAIIATIRHIAPVFGGINLEDIAAPKCFEIEKRLQGELDIPVIHDDQHATAVAVLAGLINAFKVTSRDASNSKVVVLGAGAAGNGVVKLLSAYRVTNIIVVDSKGILSMARKDLDDNKAELVRITNPKGISGSLTDALKDADVVLGLSQAGILTPSHIKSMATDPIVFAMSNPVPEIMPDVAMAAGASVVATGRSDFANQINNVLVFPGMFKGAMEAGVKSISVEMKLAAAKHLAAIVGRPTVKKIIPSVFDGGVVEAVASAVVAQARML